MFTVTATSSAPACPLKNTLDSDLVFAGPDRVRLCPGFFIDKGTERFHNKIKTEPFEVRYGYNYSEKYPG
jgi:hypothetical protein